MKRPYNLLSVRVVNEDHCRTEERRLFCIFISEEMTKAYTIGFAELAMHYRTDVVEFYQHALILVNSNDLRNDVALVILTSVFFFNRPCHISRL